MFGFYLTDLQSNFWFTKIIKTVTCLKHRKKFKHGLVFKFFFVKLRLDLYICRNVTLWSLVNLLDVECHTLEGNQVQFYFGTLIKIRKRQNTKIMSNQSCYFGIRTHSDFPITQILREINFRE